MDIFPEIELSKEQHDAIEALRNQFFSEHQVARSYFKQLIEKEFKKDDT